MIILCWLEMWNVAESDPSPAVYPFTVHVVVNSWSVELEDILYVFLDVYVFCGFRGVQ